MASSVARQTEGLFRPEAIVFSRGRVIGTTEYPDSDPSLYVIRAAGYVLESLGVYSKAARWIPDLEAAYRVPVSVMGAA
ncbi:hypothetical protein [Mycolicibacterium hippocampi]|uniref:hypothetical protein n=1 Tax=Mycolicibacterium hippocampi TaxID=659824 RepID=UPI0035189EFA